MVIDGPWAEPRIYPDMAGMLDNPDAAYAKLKEMGKGLFGPSGALRDWAALGAGRQARRGNGNGSAPGSGTADQLGGNLGADPGQSDPAGPEPEPQGLQLAGPRTGAKPRHSDPGTSATGGARPRARRSAAGQQDSQPMNDVLRQLFNR